MPSDLAPETAASAGVNASTNCCRTQNSRYEVAAVVSRSIRFCCRSCIRSTMAACAWRRASASCCARRYSARRIICGMTAGSCRSSESAFVSCHSCTSHDCSVNVSDNRPVGSITQTSSPHGCRRFARAICCGVGFATRDDRSPIRTLNQHPSTCTFGGSSRPTTTGYPRSRNASNRAWQIVKGARDRSRPHTEIEQRHGRAHDAAVVGRRLAQSVTCLHHRGVFQSARRRKRDLRC